MRFRLTDTRVAETLGPRQQEWRSLFKKLDDAKSLTDGWDSYEAPPPSELAIVAGRDFLDDLKGRGILPKRLNPVVTGGIGITCHSNENEAYVEFDNKGRSALLLAKGDVDEPEIIGFDVAKATERQSIIDRLATFLSTPVI